MGVKESELREAGRFRLHFQILVDLEKAREAQERLLSTHIDADQITAVVPAVDHSFI